MTNLLTLPQELRDMITKEVLRSSTGHINLLSSPDSPELFLVLEASPSSTPSFSGTLDLSILRTCTQLYNAYRHLFWKLNTLSANPGVIGYDLTYLPLEQQHAIQSVNLKFDVLSMDIWNHVAIDQLGVWARDGALRSVTLTLMEPDEVPMVAVLSSVQMWRRAILFHEDTLEKTGRNGGLLSQIPRKIVLDTRTEGLLVSYLDLISSVDAVLKGLLNKFGGEVWVDGKLRFSA